jgi:hypothetical protein
VRRLCSKATTKINDELEKQFPTQDVMDVLGLVHPQYWLKCSDLSIHMAILKGFYC